MVFGVCDKGSFRGEWPQAETVEQGDGEEGELGQWTVLKNDLLEEGRG